MSKMCKFVLPELGTGFWLVPCVEGDEVINYLLDNRNENEEHTDSLLDAINGGETMVMPDPEKENWLECDENWNPISIDRRL